jgi:hypothetical protein
MLMPLAPEAAAAVRGVFAACSWASSWAANWLPDWACSVSWEMGSCRSSASVSVEVVVELAALVEAAGGGGGGGPWGLEAAGGGAVAAVRDETLEIELMGSSFRRGRVVLPYLLVGMKMASDERLSGRIS